MAKRIKLFTVMAALCFISSQTTFAAQPGKTETVFNKRFIRNLKPMMPYEKLVTLIGTPGAAVRDRKDKSPGTVRYHWDGGKSSALNARFAAGKMLGATMLAPNGNSYSIGKAEQ